MLAMAALTGIFAQENVNKNIFRQLTQELPSPYLFRTASGRPGPEYFQQKVDYKMDIRLDENNDILYGNQVVTYYNNSPEILYYLYLQLDQNVREPNSFGSKTSVSGMNSREHINTFMNRNDDFEGGFKIDSFTDLNGASFETVKNHTILKVIFKKPLEPGGNIKIKFDWH